MTLSHRQPISPAYVRWTAEEDRILKANCGKGYAPLLALLPVHNKRSIRQRASRHGWLVCPHLTREHRARIALMVRSTIAATSGKGACIKWLRAHVAHRGESCLIWPFGSAPVDTPRKQKAGGGYAVLGYRGRVYKAGVLMCQMVNGSKPSPNHRAGYTCGKGNEGCVHPLHVQWMTPGEISAIAWRDPNRVRHERTLTETKVAEIRASTGTQLAIADHFHTHPSHIGKIIRRETWITGKRGHHGFQVGDPRNQGGVFAMRRRAVTIDLSDAGQARALDDLAFVNAMVPDTVPGRSDIIQEMWIALRTGARTRDTIRLLEFIRAYWQNNYDERGQTVQIDLVGQYLPDPATLEHAF